MCITAHGVSYLDVKKLESRMMILERKLDILRDQIDNTHAIATTQVYSHNFTNHLEPIYITPIARKQPSFLRTARGHTCDRNKVSNCNEFRPRKKVNYSQPTGETLRVTVRNDTRFVRSVNNTTPVDRAEKIVKDNARGVVPTQRRADTLIKGRRDYHNVPRSKSRHQGANWSEAKLCKSEHHTPEATHKESRTARGGYTYPRKYYYPREPPAIQINQAIGQFTRVAPRRA